MTEKAAAEMAHPIPEGVKGHFNEMAKKRKAEKRAGGESVDEDADEDEDWRSAARGGSALLRIRVLTKPAGAGLRSFPVHSSAPCGSSIRTIHRYRSS